MNNCRFTGVGTQGLRGMWGEGWSEATVCRALEAVSEWGRSGRLDLVNIRAMKRFLFFILLLKYSCFTMLC